MTGKAKAKERKSREHSTGRAPVVDDDSFYALQVNISGQPVVPFPFSKDLFLKVLDRRFCLTMSRRAASCRWSRTAQHPLNGNSRSMCASEVAG